MQDIQQAADILFPVYERTGGVDGYVSLEVSPLLGNDTISTMAEAARLHARIERPNLMIKIPATEAGLPAIEETIARGINVNVTLIFSLDRYAEVIEAYLRGLERRLDAGEDITQIASVASFFVSRIDTLVDQQLESNILRAQGRDLDRVAANRKLLGTAAIASARLAYQHFKGIFEGERFARLKAAGARVQRPLWASTSTKNPAYPDTIYIDNLIGPDTVNTAPPHTLRAFKDHGVAAPTLEQEVDHAHDVLDMLAEVGVNIDMVTHNLLVDGVDKFASAFQQLMASIEGKRHMLQLGLATRQSRVLGAYEPGFRDALKHMADAPERIWSKDASWWKAEFAHRQVIDNRLGWLDAWQSERIDRQRLAILQGLAQDEWQYVVLLGMGGSSLAPEVLAKTFGPQKGFPELLVLDSTAPAAIQAVEDRIDLAQTMFIVASKSGSTIETASMFDYFYRKAEDLLEHAGSHFTIITDPGSPLYNLARERQAYDVFLNPPDIGGRYSALSYFGLVPAVLMGLDLNRLCASAERMAKAMDKVVPSAGNPGLVLGVMMSHLASVGIDKVSIVASSQIASFGNWVEQLVAESTGKEGVGIVPVVGERVGTPADYSDDRLFVYLRLDDAVDDTLDAQVQALGDAGHPVYEIRLVDAYDLGGEFLRWEFATAIAGQMLSINPFDEPDVTVAKKITKSLLQDYEDDGTLPTEDAYLTEGAISLYTDKLTAEMLTAVCEQAKYDVNSLAGLLAAHLKLARSGHYIGVLAYLGANDHTEGVLHSIRDHVRVATQRAVTVGFGPRYLHSTGQLHKGGPNNGVFVQITVDDPATLPVPNKSYSFSILKQAQSLGDLQALRERNRRVIHLHITGDVRAGLAQIDAALANI